MPSLTSLSKEGIILSSAAMVFCYSACTTVRKGIIKTWRFIIRNRRLASGQGLCDDKTHEIFTEESFLVLR